MIHEPTSTARARRLRERRAGGVVMVAPITFCATATELADDAYKLPCVMYFE